VAEDYSINSGVNFNSSNINVGGTRAKGVFQPSLTDPGAITGRVEIGQGYRGRVAVQGHFEKDAFVVDKYQADAGVGFKAKGILGGYVGVGYNSDLGGVLAGSASLGNLTYSINVELNVPDYQTIPGYSIFGFDFVEGEVKYRKNYTSQVTDAKVPWGLDGPREHVHPAEWSRTKALSDILSVDSPSEHTPLGDRPNAGGIGGPKPTGASGIFG
jgi:hypothetical protein